VGGGEYFQGKNINKKSKKFYGFLGKDAGLEIHPCVLLVVDMQAPAPADEQTRSRR
jgi:hypothetical protein